MTGPGGTSTKRDQRRDSRRAQFQQRQLERQRERQRRIRQQRLQRYGGFAILAVVVLALAVFAWHPWANSRSGAGSATPTFTSEAKSGQFTTPADGGVRDGMSCLTSEGSAVHYHSYLAVFIDGKQVQVTPGAGIIENKCLYALHVHPSDDNIIHIESPSTDPYSLGNFFDIWGQPLSTTQVMSSTVDASHSLKVVIFDANGKQTTWTGNPWDVKLAAHETIFVMYNSPNVTPKAFTGWNPGE